MCYKPDNYKSYRHGRRGAIVLPHPSRYKGGVSTPQERERSMAVPRKKMSRMKRGMRRSADALTPPIYVEDKDSGELRRPHHIDLKSGKYRGKQILKIDADT